MDTQAFSTEIDKPKLDRLQKKGIYLGTSTWTYPGWLGQVYKGDYSGKKSPFLKSRFERECLSEFSRVFPTGSFDGSYYRFPSFEQLSSYADQTPDNFKMALKVTENITLRAPRGFGRENPFMRDGALNPLYLDAKTFTEHFLAPAEQALGPKLGPIIFEFSPFSFSGYHVPKDGYAPSQFVKDLEHFFEQIPAGPKYAVEVRDPVFITDPDSRYLDVLNLFGVSHVLNEQTRMPPLEEQVKIPNILTAPFAVVRALVRPGVTHHEAVDEFKPYDKTQLVLPEMRQAIADLIFNQLEFEHQLYAYFNNRTEGNAPNTIAAVLQIFDQFDP